MKSLIALEHLRQNLLAGLDQPFGPACLLSFERRHLYRKLGRALHILEVDKFPTLELRAIREVRILRQRVMLPAASLFDRTTPPHPRRAIEIEKDVATRAAGVFQYEMPVEQNRFNFGQKRIVAIDVSPSRLHHSHLGFSEVVNHFQQEIFRWHEVRVEDRDELALGRLQAFRKRPRLESLPI